MQIRYPERPFHHSYWVVPNLFLAGQFPGDVDAEGTDRKLTSLLNAGILTFINLMEADETDYDGKPFAAYWEKLAYPIRWVRKPIRDMGVPTPGLMKEILDEIDDSIQSNRPVYVHCWGGKGRTGTVVGCYLARHGIAEGKAALAKITELRRPIPFASSSPETEVQRLMVSGWLLGM